MVQYRKPPQRSKNLVDRRTNTGNTPSELKSRLAAQVKRDIEEMLKREAEAQLQRVRRMRAAQHGRGR